MGCKSCKKNSKGLVGNLLNNPMGKIINNDKTSSMWNDTMGMTSTFEKVILVLFAWIPLGVGYYHVIRFIINLF